MQVWEVTPKLLRGYPKQLLSLAGRRVGLIHGHQPPEIEAEYARPEYDYDTPAVEKLFVYLAGALPTAEIIVFGHFHTPLLRRWGDQLLVNPGSIAPHHGRQSFALLHLDPAEAEVTIVEM